MNHLLETGRHRGVEIAMNEELEPIVEPTMARSSRPARLARSGRPARLARFTSETGASLVEYALLMALIVVVCIGALQYFGSQNGSGLNRSSSCIGAAFDGQSAPTNC